MNRDEFEKRLDWVAKVQRRNGWSEQSIKMYADELREWVTDEMFERDDWDIGAGLAQDNSRYGVGG